MRDAPSRRLITMASRAFLSALLLLFITPHIYLIAEALGDERASLIASATPLALGLITNTLYLICATLAVALVLGISSAYLVTHYSFCGRRFFATALCLPFAIPASVLASVATSLNHHYGLPISFENIAGAAVVLGISLYPWIYLPLKTTFSAQRARYGEAAQNIGLSPAQRFWRITLGLARPTIAATAMLVLMAVVSDFGVAQILGIKTISSGIYEAAFTMYRGDWAAQLSLMGLGIPVAALAAYLYFYRRSRSFTTKAVGYPPRRERLHGLSQLLIITYLSTIIAVGFIVPVTLLGYWALRFIGRISLHELPAIIGDTLLFCGSVTLLAVAVALAVTTLLRINPKLRRWKLATTLINLNYAIPSAMLAIALLFMGSALQWAPLQELLSYSIILVIFGAFLQYLCFPYFTLLSGYSSISRRLDDLAEVLGLSRWRRFYTIYLPLLKKPLAVGALLILVNILKELPLSLILQPFGFQTLSLRIYNYTSVWMFQESALFSLILIGCMIYPIVRLNATISESHHDCD